MNRALETRFTVPAGVAVVAVLALLLTLTTTALAGPGTWRTEWPNTDFSKTSVDLDEIFSGGPPKDGIPSIDDPAFEPVGETTDLGPKEPVIGLVIAGDARAYPLRVLTWHEIVNDVVGGVPVAVTYCPLCNSAIVFDRRVAGEATAFGTTGKLRNSDLVMYDRATESWWQQFLGEAIAGERTGTQLEFIPARLESWQRFAARHPEGKVLVPNNPGLRAYGLNPYAGYDSSPRPFLYRGEMPEGIEPMARVVRVEDQAWPLELLRTAGRIEAGDLVLTWETGQNSALDSRRIDEGRDVGNVTVARQNSSGTEDVPYDVTFAFVFHAFYPDGTLHR
ncbi:MAG: DUF3179 domain-containing protein [Rhodospirillales bacterium]|nr:DUF3179 domain-containing protein [Rhodospirillales bacterium]